MSKSDDASVQRSDAIVSMAIGAALFALCGLCTYSVSAAGGIGGLQYFVGGIPTLLGAFLFVSGYLKLVRSRQQPSGKSDDD